MRGWLPWLVAVGLALVGVLIVGPPVQQGPTYDPTSTERSGTAAYRDVLASLGRDVSVTLDVDHTVDAVIVMVDPTDAAQRQHLRRWARDGGHLIVADPMSLLTDRDIVARPATAGIGALTLGPRCDAPATARAAAVTAADWYGLAVGDGWDGCFPIDEDAAWLLTRTQGSGRVTALGGADAFTNARFDEADNAVLAVDLVGDAERIVFLPHPDTLPADEQRSLVGMLPQRVVHGLWVGLLAFAVAVVAYGRRVGRPVAEDLPVRVPATGMVDGLGGLLQRGGHASAAAADLRADLRRELAGRWGVPPDADPGMLQSLVIERAGVGPHDVTLALGDAAVRDADGLEAVAAAVARVRAAVHDTSRIAT
jgi:hypothetical protein